MTQVRCPQERCSFWLDGWCDADEIELDLASLSCITFDEIEPTSELLVVGNADEDDDELDLEWDDDESIFEEDLDESLYGIDDGDPEFGDEDEEDTPAEEESLWGY